MPFSTARQSAISLTVCLVGAGSALAAPNTAEISPNHVAGLPAELFALSAVEDARIAAYAWDLDDSDGLVDFREGDSQITITLPEDDCYSDRWIALQVTDHDGTVDVSFAQIQTDCSQDDDGDGLRSLLEIMAGTDPQDADSDDDGVLDGQEPDWNVDVDNDGLINALDPDSDNDGILDGVEEGINAADLTPDTDLSAGNFEEAEPEADDFVEDDDGIMWAIEAAAGTSPWDIDSDDDGVPDGLEPLWNVDSDGDGLINALDADSDNDGILDGTEMGYTLADIGVDTNLEAGNFLADNDPTTQTDPLQADTDADGIPDGVEDYNKNGAVDRGEDDPNNPIVKGDSLDLDSSTPWGEDAPSPLSGRDENGPNLRLITLHDSRLETVHAQIDLADEALGNSQSASPQVDLRLPGSRAHSIDTPNEGCTQTPGQAPKPWGLLWLALPFLGLRKRLSRN